MNLAIGNPEGLKEGVPSYENLVTHIERFGLDREKPGYNGGKLKVYKTYRQFRTDSAMEVGRSYLAIDPYASLVTRYGDPRWEDEARKDWEEEHGN